MGKVINKKLKIETPNKFDISSSLNQSIGDWSSKECVMNFFNYSDTAMLELEKSLIVSKIGRRTFYSTQSLIDLLNKNVVKKKSLIL